MTETFSPGALSVLLWLALALGGLGLAVLFFVLIREAKEKTLW